MTSKRDPENDRIWEAYRNGFMNGMSLATTACLAVLAILWLLSLSR